MNRKFALFIVIALLTSLVWVSSVLAAPETTMNVCVTLEGTRAGAAAEPAISYQLTKQSGGTVYAASGAASTISGAPSTTGCFDVVAEPGELYDVKVWGADTLTASVDGFTINDGVTLPLTLKEGDANGDGTIGFSDFSLLAAQYDPAIQQPLASADFNEDNLVAFSDFSLLAANYGDSSRAQEQMETSMPRGTVGTAMVKPGSENYATIVAGDTYKFSVQIENPTNEPIRTANIWITYDSTKYHLPSSAAGGVRVSFGCNPACHFNTLVPLTPSNPGDGNGAAEIAAGFLGGELSGEASIKAVELHFVAQAGANGDTNVSGPAVFTIHSGDSDTPDPGDGSKYTASARADFQFANCPLPAGSACASATAIALNSNVATPSQSVATIVLVFVASALVIGSRFAVLNKRK